MSTPCRKKPSHVLSPRPARPTRFIPSFQSPAPNSGSPCAPLVMLLSIARTQCSNSGAVFGETTPAIHTTPVRRSDSSGAFRNGTRSFRTHGIARRAHVLGDDVREPEQVVGASGAEAAAERFVPPVLDIAFDELPCRRAEQVLARKIGPCEGQRHDVLQLIAKAERPAGLVVPAARPEAAADRLVQQPAIHQHVERVVRRVHLHGVERPIPRPPAPGASAASASSDAAVARDELAGMIAIGALSQQEEELAPFSRPQDASNLKRRARIQARADVSGERRLAHRRRCARCRRCGRETSARSAVKELGASPAYEKAT